jgi:hypothetical protein
LSIRRPISSGCGVKHIICSGIVVLTLALTIGSASAQNFFEALFGGLWKTPPTAYADPSGQLNPFGAREQDMGGTAYCVRLCDGRYFPIQRHANITTAQACSSFCPASATKIYSGGSIEHAVGSDGKRYSELNTAFVYREKIVPGCTCNGKDAFGLVNTKIADDTTLHPGDIVATNTGLMAYNGGAKQPDFTPIQAYGALSPDLRRTLAETKVAPATEKPAVPVKQVMDASPRGSRSKRVQADR